MIFEHPTRSCRNNHRAPAVEHISENDAIQATIYSDRNGFESAEDFASLKDGEVFYGNQGTPGKPDNIGKSDTFGKSENPKSRPKLGHGEVVGCCGHAPKVRV